MISSSSTTRMEPLRRMGPSCYGLGGARRPLDRRRRKFEDEPRALADDALAVDRAVVLAHDAVGDGQAEAGALADRLGREERIVDAGEVLARNAGAGVRQLPPMACRPSSDVVTDSQPPFGIASFAFRNRLRNTCCSLCSNPSTIDRLGEQLAPHLDVLQLELVLEQREHVVDDRVEIDRRRDRRPSRTRAATGSAGR